MISHNCKIEMAGVVKAVYVEAIQFNERSKIMFNKVTRIVF